MARVDGLSDVRDIIAALGYCTAMWDSAQHVIGVR